MTARLELGWEQKEGRGREGGRRAMLYSKDSRATSTGATESCQCMWRDYSVPKQRPRWPGRRTSVAHVVMSLHVARLHWGAAPAS